MFKVKVVVGEGEERTSSYRYYELDKALDDAMETVKSLIKYASFSIRIVRTQEYSTDEEILSIKANGIVI